MQQTFLRGFQCPVVIIKLVDRTSSPALCVIYTVRILFIVQVLTRRRPHIGAWSRPRRATDSAQGASESGSGHGAQHTRRQ